MPQIPNTSSPPSPVTSTPSPTVSIIGTKTTAGAGHRSPWARNSPVANGRSRSKSVPGVMISQRLTFRPRATWSRHSDCSAAASPGQRAVTAVGSSNTSRRATGRKHARRAEEPLPPGTPPRSARVRMRRAPDQPGRRADHRPFQALRARAARPLDRRHDQSPLPVRSDQTGWALVPKAWPRPAQASRDKEQRAVPQHLEEVLNVL